MKKSLRQRIMWYLFGEDKIFFWFFAGIVLFNLLFWGGIAFVALHFITKHW